MDLKLDRNVPALVAKLGHYPSHHGGVGAIRSLGRAGVRVFAITEDRHTPAAHSRWLSGMFVWQNETLDTDALLDGLTEIAERIGDRPVVIATDDRMAAFLADHSERLRPVLRTPEQPPGLAATVASKLGLSRVCAEAGVPTARVLLPSDRAEALDFCAEIGFPVIAKATDASKLVGTDLVSTSILRDRAEVDALWDRLEAQGITEGSILLQEFLGDGEDWIVQGYCDAGSTAVAAFSGVKLRSYPAFAGMTTMARAQHNEALLDRARALFAHIGYRGPMDMDWRLDRRDGQYKLLDFNPRVGAQFRLFVDEHGLDVVRAQHLDLSGRPVPAGHVRDGRTFMVEHTDLMAGLGAYRRAGLAPRDWVRSVRHVDEPAWWSADDPMPAQVLTARMAGRRAARIASRFSPRSERSAAPPGPVGPTFHPGRRAGD